MTMWRQMARDRERSLGSERCRIADAVELLWGRITDVSYDIDVWEDARSGAALAAVKERLGNTPGLVALQSEYARLLRRAALRGRPELEEVAA